VVKRLEGFRFEPTGRDKYDWDRLLDGGTWFIPEGDMNAKDGDDVALKIARFRRTAYAAAKARAMKLQTQSTDDGLVIQAVR
jgi:hypothetical protein